MAESNFFAGPNFQQVQVYSSIDSLQFDELTRQGRPFVFNGTDFGQCMTRWNLEYLKDRLQDQQMIIHVSDQSELEFVNKNFQYHKCSFLDFSRQLVQGSSKHVYLRSISADSRSKRPASIERDFPTIAQDLKPPGFIPFGDDNKLYYSSVLRIASAKVQIWTHFDLYDNVLCQVKGSKRILLFAPEDSENLYMNGDKSAVNNFDDWPKCCSEFPLVAKTKPFKCQLNPGEVIFIPSLWWHNIRTCSENTMVHDVNPYSIGFNIFWRDKQLCDKSIYAENDVYGNKNLVPFEAALANLDKAISHVNKLPGKYNKFYKLRLFKRLEAELVQTTSAS